MWPLVVIERKVLGQPEGEFCHVAITLEVQVFILEAAPEALNKGVVKGPPSTVQADGHTFSLEHIGEGRTRELRALVAIKDLRFAMPPVARPLGNQHRTLGPCCC